MADRVNRIVWSKNALRDIKEIFEYWNRTNGNKDYSRKLNKEFSSLVDLLMLFPRIGRTVENYDIRFLCKYEYIIFYKTKGSIKKPDIEIIQVWDSRRDPLELKL
jgi:plasmid stabilization system protein ParE